MGLDSIELIMGFEEYFSISIPDNEASSLYTVQSLVECVGRHLNVNSDDAKIQSEMLGNLSDALQLGESDQAELKLTDLISKYYDPNDDIQTKLLEHQLGLTIKGVTSNTPRSGSLLAKVKNAFVWASSYEWNKVTVASFIDAICAHNLENFVDRNNITSKYEIYLAVMRLTVDKIGVEYLEISPDKSFTKDLGID